MTKHKNNVYNYGKDYLAVNPIRLKGKGIQRLNGRGKGDQYGRSAKMAFAACSGVTGSDAAAPVRAQNCSGRWTLSRMGFPQPDAPTTQIT